MLFSLRRQINYKDLFPTAWSFLIFISYMGLFVNQGLLVTGSKTATHSYNYNIIVVVLLTEFVKLISALTIYWQTHSFSQLRRDIDDNQTGNITKEKRHVLTRHALKRLFRLFTRKERKLFLLYFIPSVLYCIYNNLAFTNLSSYDPTTYYLLLQFRVVVTGIIFQFLFSKRLTRLQWLSLFLLTSGCIIKQFEHSSSSAAAAAIKISKTNSTLSPLNGQTAVNITSIVNINLMWILVQVFCSCFAGVYNEYLLKSDRTIQVDVMLQNVFMYTDSIICNLILLTYFDYQQPNLSFMDKFSNTLKLITSGKEILILFIIINNAAVGIVTSLFLKQMGTIFKTFASALELLFTSILAWIIFAIPVSIYTFIAIFIVSTAFYLYSINPVVSVPNEINPSNNINNGHEQERRVIV